MESKPSMDQLPEVPKKKKSSKLPEVTFGSDSQDAGITDQISELLSNVARLYRENQKLNEVINQLREESQSVYTELTNQVLTLQAENSDLNQTVNAIKAFNTDIELQVLRLASELERNKQTFNAHTNNSQVSESRNDSEISNLREDLQEVRDLSTAVQEQLAQLKQNPNPSPVQDTTFLAEAIRIASLPSPVLEHNDKSSIKKFYFKFEEYKLLGGTRPVSTLLRKQVVDNH